MSSKGLDIFAGGSRAHGLGGHSDIHHAIVNSRSPSHAPNRLTAFVPLISYDSYGSNGVGTNFREAPISRSNVIREINSLNVIHVTYARNIFRGLFSTSKNITRINENIPTFVAEEFYLHTKRFKIPYCN